MSGWLRQHPVGGFLVLAFAGSWLAWTPPVVIPLVTGKSLPLAVEILLNQVALFAGPFLASLVMSRLTEGSLAGWKARLLGWRAPWSVYLMALVVVPATLLAGLVLLPSSPAGEPRLSGPAAVIAPLVMAVGFVVGGPLQEEPGWRGYLLPRLQQRWHPLGATVVLGVVWGMWHLPQFLVPQWSTPKESWLDVVAFVLFTVTASVPLSWVANRGSTLLAVLGHNSLNWVLEVYGQVTGRQVTSLWPAVAALTVLSVVLVGATRGRLGCPATSEPAGALVGDQPA